MLERFRADGHEVADLGLATDPEAATAAAIRARAAVIYQGTLTGNGGALFGRPDFLVRANCCRFRTGTRGRPGRHYEVVDAKLARTAKARAVSCKARSLASCSPVLQGPKPRWMTWPSATGVVSFKG